MRFRGFAACALMLCFAAHCEEPGELSAAEKEKIAAQIAQLGSEDFDERSNAARQLKKFDARVEPLLREALEKAADLETAGRLKTLISRYETQAMLRNLAADYGNDPDRMRAQSRSTLATFGNGAVVKPEKTPRETHALMRLAAALYKRQAKVDADVTRRQRSTMMAEMCEHLAVFATQKGPATDIDDKAVRLAAEELAAELLPGEEKK